MAARPLVLPETYNGEKSWDDWVEHFESVADVNEWTDDAKKLKWLHVRLTGRAASAFKKFPAATKADYKLTTEALKKRFEPESRKELYLAEMQSRRKRRDEDWATLGEELKTLAEKAYPGLQDEAQEVLALNHYLAQLDNPQVSFGVRQKQPKTVDEAVQHTLELESYLRPSRPGKVSQVSAEDDSETIAAASSRMDPMVRIMKRLDELKSVRHAPAPSRDRDQPREGRGRRERQERADSGPVVCHRCGKEGHFVRGCAARVKQSQGNEHPSTQ